MPGRSAGEGGERDRDVGGDPDRHRVLVEDDLVGVVGRGLAGLDPGRASILLAHAPSGLRIAEQAGVSLQLSGHTHGGQIFPFTWLIRRIFRKYARGLHRHGKLMVYPASGCGTWGPPMRVGTRPEIALLKLE